MHCLAEILIAFNIERVITTHRVVGIFDMRISFQSSEP